MGFVLHTCHLVRRILAGETPQRMIWVVMVVEEMGRIVPKRERERILRSRGIDTTTANEVDVYDWL